MKKLKIRRRMKDRMVAGVCSAIADSFKIDPIWIRLIVILTGLYFFPWVFVAYFVAAIIIPIDDTEDNVVEQFKKLYRIKENAKIGGVCTGLEKYFDVDVVTIRLLFLLLFFVGGLGLLVYLVLWMITPQLQITTPT